MKKRNPAAVLLLPFVTLGIYCIYWLYATRKELISRNGDARSIPPVIVLLLPILLLIGLMIALFAFSFSRPASNIVTTLTIVGGMAGVIGILAVPLWWTWKYCRVVANTINDMDFTQLYVLYVAISWLCNLMPVWMLIVQLSFNKLADAETAGQTAPHQSKLAK